MKGKVKRIVGFSAIAVILVFFFVANCILFDSKMATTITGLLCPPIAETYQSEEEEDGSAKELSRRIVEEGSVLVKNNGVLPLSRSESGKVSVFGRGSVDWIWSGAGSGGVQPETNDLTLNIDLLKALKNYGIGYYDDLAKFYTSWMNIRGVGGSIGAGEGYHRLAEPAMSEYPAAVLTGASEYSSTAFVVIGRRSGETVDAPLKQLKEKYATDESRHTLEISTEEEALLKYVGETYDKVVVVINSTNVMELGFMDTIPGLDACLIVGTTGTHGAAGIPGVLYGETSPSGKLVDTYAYEMESNVNFNNVGKQGTVIYDNEGEGLYPQGVGLNSWSGTPTAPMYIDYIEGIYVGYKWYETADAEGIWNGKTREILDGAGQKATRTGFDAVVQYPFGYGLSYTSFEWTVKSVTPSNNAVIDKDTTIEITVNVKNVGDVTGKDVVELYLTAPYYDGEIEKSHVRLVAYAKTGDIEKGKSQDVTLSVKAYDMASYDCYDANENNHTGYELDEGAYALKLMTDSHTIKTVTMDGAQKQGVLTFNVENDILYDTDPYTGEKVDNLFTGDGAIDGVSVDGLGAAGGNQNVQYISRENFPKAAPELSARRKMAERIKKYNLFSDEDARQWNDATTDEFGDPVDTSAVTFGAKNGKVIFDSMGVTELGFQLGSDYDDPEWDALLDQLVRSEGISMIGIGASGTPAVPSVTKPVLDDKDGPAQALGFVSVKERGEGFPSAFIVAQTWSEEIAFEYGVSFGQEMDRVNLEGIFGFGCNIHRSPFGGRNFEYYSEDAFLSGKCAAKAMYGLKCVGKYGFLKHFAVAENETARDGYYSWLSEQALREVFLKPFQMAVEEGGCVGIMSAYNRVGGTWAGGSAALLDGALRKEWGFRGAVITDFSDHNQYMNQNQAIRHGGDLGMYCGLNGSTSNGVRMDHAIRDAVHNTLYMWLNSQYTAKNADLGYSNKGSLGESWVWWKPVLIDIDIMVGASCALWAYMLLTKKDKKNKKKGKAKA